MTRWRVVPERSTVWIDGSSTVHPIRASATGISGWLDGELDETGWVPSTAVQGHLEIEVSRLASGNPLVDRETRRRIDARRYPLITGGVSSGGPTDAVTLGIDGVIHFRGEQVDVAGELQLVERSDVGFVLEGMDRFDVGWWGLRVPRLGLLRVHPVIEVRVRLEFGTAE